MVNGVGAHGAAPPRDRRKVNLYLTARGESVYTRAVAILMEENKTLVAGLDPEGLREATRLMQRVPTNLLGGPAAAEVVNFGPADRDRQ